MKGIYCLLIDVPIDMKADIGSLGSIEFPKGSYVYVGSAQNSIEKRVARHYRKEKKLRWHIDYLLSQKGVTIKKTFSRTAGKNQECKAAGLIAGVSSGIPRFGCSDCRCSSHLFRLSSKISFKDIRMEVFR
jgi:Uri superfamily endonuclease